MSSASELRPTCSVFLAISVDGYIARADGRLDWLALVERAGEDYGYQAFVSSVDVHVIGRNTYDAVLGFEGWPYGDKRCVVLTHRPAAPRQREEFFAGEPRELLTKLAREGVRRVYVDGGRAIQSFLHAGVIDELTLSIVPVVLGGGIQLFTPGFAEQRLSLHDSRAFPSGLVQLTYRTRAEL